jgi:hypothetical protein
MAKKKIMTITNKPIIYAQKVNLLYDITACTTVKTFYLKLSWFRLLQCQLPQHIQGLSMLF